MKIITLFKNLLILSLLVSDTFQSNLSAENSNKLTNSIKVSEGESEGESEEMESELSEKLNLNGQIYLKGASSKHRKSHSTLTTNSFAKNKVETNLKSNQKSRATSENKSKNSQHSSGDDIKTTHQHHDSPILAEFWVKYFKFSNTEVKNIRTLKKFFVNNGFYQQTKLFPNTDFSKGKDFIKDSNHFYLSLFKNSFVFTSSKRVRKLNNKKL